MANEIDVVMKTVDAETTLSDDEFCNQCEELYGELAKLLAGRYATVAASCIAQLIYTSDPVFQSEFRRAQMRMAVILSEQRAADDDAASAPKAKA